MSEENREVLPDPGGQVTNGDAANPEGQNVSKSPVKGPILKQFYSLGKYTI